MSSCPTHAVERSSMESVISKTLRMGSRCDAEWWKIDGAVQWNMLTPLQRTRYYLSHTSGMMGKALS